MKLQTKLLLTILVLLKTKYSFSNIHSLEHELSKIEEICEEASTQWNGCPKHSLGLENL